MFGRALFLLGSSALLVACASETPQQKHELGCAAGTLTGALVGGLAGSLIGGGTGKVIATAVGAAGGGLAGNKLTCE